MDQLDAYARQQIPSVKSLLDHVNAVSSPGNSGSGLLSVSDSQSLSQLEQKKLELMAEKYACDLENDALLYRRFRESHVDKLNRWQAALEEHKKKSFDHDWNGAKSYVDKHLKILGRY